MTSATILPPPLISPEVRAFAAEKGVERYLPELAAAARRLFPDSRINLRVADDPELSCNRQIVFEVDENGRNASEQVAAHRQWIDELLRCCPTTHVHVFCLIQGPLT
jgi:hypothetical protein